MANDDCMAYGSFGLRSGARARAPGASTGMMVGKLRITAQYLAHGIQLGGDCTQHAELGHAELPWRFDGDC